jgi:hypothetical protein
MIPRATRGPRIQSHAGEVPHFRALPQMAGVLNVRAQ